MPHRRSENSAIFSINAGHRMAMASGRRENMAKRLAAGVAKHSLSTQYVVAAFVNASIAAYH
jgi:hypothetical protein